MLANIMLHAKTQITACHRSAPQTMSFLRTSAQHTGPFRLVLTMLSRGLSGLLCCQNGISRGWKVAGNVAGWPKKKERRGESGREWKRKRGGSWPMSLRKTHQEELWRRIQCLKSFVYFFLHCKLSQDQLSFSENSIQMHVITRNAK